MAKENFVCPDCGATFGSKWALTDHATSCPVKKNAELRRAQEKLNDKKARVEKWIEESYRNAARAFSFYHNGNVEQARMMHKWLAEDFDYRVRDLEDLSDGIAQAQRVYFPNMTRLASDVKLLVEQTKDLASILSTLNDKYGVLL